MGLSRPFVMLRGSTTFSQGHYALEVRDDMSGVLKPFDIVAIQRFNSRASGNLPFQTTFPGSRAVIKFLHLSRIKPYIFGS